MKQVIQFLKEVRQEMTRVQWPSRDELIGATIVVFIIISFFIVFIWAVDRTHKWLIYDVIYRLVQR